MSSCPANELSSISLLLTDDSITRVTAPQSAKSRSRNRLIVAAVIVIDANGAIAHAHTESEISYTEERLLEHSFAEINFISLPQINLQVFSLSLSLVFPQHAPHISASELCKEMLKHLSRNEFPSEITKCPIQSESVAIPPRKRASPPRRR